MRDLFGLYAGRSAIVSPSFLLDPYLLQLDALQRRFSVHGSRLDRLEHREPVDDVAEGRVFAVERARHAGNDEK